MLLFLNVIYVLIAIAMIALILMQRGAGAQAGSGFGAGASGTVFGSRGASNFLSKSTKWLAIAFFAISLFMAWNASRGAVTGASPATAEKGLMSQVPAAPSAPAGNAAVPTAPAATAPANTAPASTVPVAPAETVAPPADGAATQQQPAPTQPASGG
jgi:preprotein translocase subunit SecG